LFIFIFLKIILETKNARANKARHINLVRSLLGHNVCQTYSLNLYTQACSKATLVSRSKYFGIHSDPFSFKSRCTLLCSSSNTSFSLVAPVYKNKHGYLVVRFLIYFLSCNIISNGGFVFV